MRTLIRAGKLNGYQESFGLFLEVGAPGGGKLAVRAVEFRAAVPESAEGLRACTAGSEGRARYQRGGCQREAKSGK